jgi:deoxyxylulose-5-phosphate synthase
MGLRQEIKSADSESEIMALLNKGRGFEFASEHTQHAWKSTAKFRLKELSSKDVTQSPEKPVQSKKSVKKTK